MSPTTTRRSPRAWRAAMSFVRSRENSRLYGSRTSSAAALGKYPATRVKPGSALTTIRPSWSYASMPRPGVCFIPRPFRDKVAAPE
jgi:hypothetical protein